MEPQDADITYKHIRYKFVGEKVYRWRGDEWIRSTCDKSELIQASAVKEKLRVYDRQRKLKGS